jgi:hypothetical protein
MNIHYGIHNNNNSNNSNKRNKRAGVRSEIEVRSKRTNHGCDG